MDQQLTIRFPDSITHRHILLQVCEIIKAIGRGEILVWNRRPGLAFPLSRAARGIMYSMRIPIRSVAVFAAEEGELTHIDESTPEAEVKVKVFPFPTTYAKRTWSRNLASDPGMDSSGETLGKCPPQILCSADQTLIDTLTQELCHFKPWVKVHKIS